MLACRCTFSASIIGPALLLGLASLGRSQAQPSNLARSSEMLWGPAYVEIDRTSAIANTNSNNNGRPPAGRLIAVMLDKQIPELRFEGDTLSDVLEFLADVTGMNFRVDWTALQAVGATKRIPVTVRLRDVRLSTALDAILESAAAKSKLDYFVDDEMLIISTTTELDRKIVTRTYDVAGLASANGTHASLAERIKRAVVPDGSHESMKIAIGAPGNEAVVTAPATWHRRVESVLLQLRQQAGLQVMIECRFVELEREAFGPVARELKMHTPAATGEAVDKGIAESLLVTLGEDAARRFEFNKSTTATVLSAPRIVVISGQRGSIRIADVKTYVTGYRTQDGKFLPIIENVGSGLAVGVGATVGRDRSHIALTIDLRKTALVGFRDEPQAGNDDTVRRADLSVQERKVKADVAPGSTLLFVLPPKTEDKSVVLCLIRPTVFGKPEEP